MPSPRPILTDGDISRLKAENLAEFPEHVSTEGPDGQAYTCERCEARYTCPFSMDPYNTTGDCLASK